MISFKNIRVIGMVAVSAVLALGLGGCNKDKEAAQAAQAESEQLRAENEGLKSANGQLTAQNQQLLSDLANKPVQTPMGGDYPMGGGDTGSGGKKRNTGGGGGGGGDSGSVARLTVAGDVLFSPGSDSVSSGGKKELDKVAATIKNKYAGHRIRVEGYTDSDPIKKSKWGSNEALSAARAASVERYLISKGISGGKIESVGMGAAKPKASKAASRRVEIVILK